MDIVIILCLIIFITYILIICVLAYYFFRHRNIWNKTFEKTHLLEYFECPIHSIFPFLIPNIISTTENYSQNCSQNCSQCKQEQIENNINILQLETLREIYKLFKQLDNNVSSKYKMFKWLIECSIKDYEIIKNENIDVYYKLKDAYSNSTNNRKDILETEFNLDLENITYLENNIEILENIIKYIKEYYNLCNENKNGNDINYLVALFNDIEEYSKIYILKVKLL
jgi:hypothetical protein